MPRRLRYLPPGGALVGGALVEVTCRTVHSRYLLRPDDQVNEIIVGVVGRARDQYPVEIIGLVCMSNHLHALLWVEDVKALSQFMGYLNGNMAKELGKRHGWRQKFWSRRYRMIPVSDEPAAQIGRLKYLLAQGAKEGLVAEPEDWPGVHCAKALADGEPLRGTWFSRSQEYEARQRGETFGRYHYATAYEVPLTKLPCWSHLDDETYRARIRELLEQIHEEAAQFRKGKGIVLRARRKVRRALQRVHPHSAPEKPARSPCPPVHAASKRVRREMKNAYALFVVAYREAAEPLRNGVRSVQFPEGCFPPALPFVRAAVARSP